MTVRELLTALAGVPADAHVVVFMTVKREEGVSPGLFAGRVKKLESVSQGGHWMTLELEAEGHEVVPPVS